MLSDFLLGLLQLVGFVLLFGFIWYIYFYAEYFMNGGSAGRQEFLFVFDCFAEDIQLYYSSIRTKKKVEFVNGLFPEGIDTVVCSSKGSWTRDMILDSSGNICETKCIKCFYDVVSNGYVFAAKNIVILAIAHFIVY